MNSACASHARCFLSLIHILAVIFGLLGIVNFAHGAFYMLGAFAAYIGLQYFGVNYWFALVLSPLAVALLGMLIERLFLRHLYSLDPLYGLLLTFGVGLIAEGIMRDRFGASGKSYPVPHLLQGAFDLGFMVLPIYRAWVVVASLAVCAITWFLIERTRLGATPVSYTHLDVYKRQSRRCPSRRTCCCRRASTPGAP